MGEQCRPNDRTKIDREITPPSAVDFAVPVNAYNYDHRRSTLKVGSLLTDVKSSLNAII